MKANTPAPEQIEITSLMFPEDRKVLRVGEIATLLRVTEQHILDLLEEGKMLGIDAAGRHEFVRVHRSAIAELATRLKISEDLILAIFERHKPLGRSSRSTWRIPVEGWSRFLRENSSIYK